MPGFLLPILIIFPTPSHEVPLPDSQDNLAAHFYLKKYFCCYLKLLIQHVYLN